MERFDKGRRWVDKAQNVLYENCVLCKGDRNFKINFISSMNCTSSFSTFDLGTVKNIHYCPVCGRYLD